MGGEKTRPLRLPLLFIFLLHVAVLRATKICPVHCFCDNVELRASCENANLDTLPILLNPEVRHINLSYNKIVTIDFALGNYRNLVSLDLSFNKIQKLGSENFISQINLRQLNMSNNEIGNLTKDSLTGLRSLTDLDLSYNNLRLIHEHVFRDLHSLRILKLSSNQLEHLERGLFKHSKLLEELHLDSNQLMNVPVAAFADAVKLKFLSFSDNYIGDLEEGEMPTLPELRTLLLDGNSVNEVHTGALSGVIALNHLDLSNNNFTAVPTASLAKLSNLTKLKLRGNFMTTVPPVAFRGLFHLKFLYLDGLEILNSIDARAFVDNINLERVWLDNNIAVRTLPTMLFHGNKHLTHVSVRNNRLTTLEVTHFPLDQLKLLRLSDNPFECNCSLLWLWRLGQEQLKTRHDKNKTDALVIDTEGVRCAGPDHLEGLAIEQATETQMGCSMGLVATISAAASAVVVLGTVLAFICLGPVRRKLKKRGRRRRRTEKADLEVEGAPSCQNGTAGLRNYNEPQLNKYIIGPPIIRDYPALPPCPWEKYRQDDDAGDMYRQFDGKVGRPHIVYV